MSGILSASGVRAPRTRRRSRRWASISVIGALVATAFTTVGALAVAPTAQAETNITNQLLTNDQTQSAYLAAGDVLSVNFVKTRESGVGSNTTFTAVDPNGVTQWTCTVAVADPNGTACANPTLTGAAGVWQIRMVDDSASSANQNDFTWNSVVTNGGTPISGRIWTSAYGVHQLDADPVDMTLWMVSDAGYIYQTELTDYNGIYSLLAANAVGNTATPGSCVSSYQSVEGVQFAAAQCPQYRMFFEEPAADLPATAPSANGVVSVLPPIIDPAALAVTDLAFAPNGTGSAGTFTYSIDRAFFGNYWLEVDTNGDGDYSDPEDRRIQQGANGTGSYTTPFDGVDGLGNPIADCTRMNARIFYDKAGEIHFTNVDVEGRGGISFTRLNGAGAPDSTAYWNDTTLTVPKDNTTPVLDGTAGVDSSAGVHGWGFLNTPPPAGSWGNQRTIDDWAFAPLNLGTGEIAINQPCLALTKTSDVDGPVAVGDDVTYTVTVTNTGGGDFTDAEPARALDDLTDILDDATYNGDISATAGAATVTGNQIEWSGPLADGASASFTYSVTVTNAGNHRLRNTAVIPPDLCPDNEPTCTGITDEPLPNIIPSKSSDPVSGTAVVAGQVVSYTLQFTNNGQAVGTIDSTDDLTDVLDDADVTSEPVADVAGVTAERTGTTIAIGGPLQPGQTVSVTYQVTMKADADRGNNLARNVLSTPVPPVCGPDGCPPTITEHPLPLLTASKAVDPASGTTVQAGQVLTYTLTFTNAGQAPATVEYTDDLSGVLDDADTTTQPASDTLTVSPISGGQFGITGTVAPGATATVTYQETVRPDGSRGDDQLGNFLLPPGATPGECEPGDPLCTVNYVSAITVVKSSDPATGSSVDPGQRVTYTLTFTNVSQNPQAADAPIAYTDHMADVLDDATLTPVILSSAASIQASAAGSEIVITGALASGQTATVSYVVVVKSYSDQGNHQLGNVVSPTGAEPICVPGSGLCTTHRVPPPVPAVPLAITGADSLPGVLVGLALLVLGGALVLMRRRFAVHGR